MNKINSVARHSTGISVTKRRHTSRLAITGAALAILVAPMMISVAAANAATGFTVTSPTSASTVQNSAELPSLVTFTGEGLPDTDTIDVQYTTAAGTPQTATYSGTTSAADGSWSTTANFGDLAQGATTVTAIVSAHLADGSADSSITPARVIFELAHAPNPAYPFTLSSPSPLEVVTTSTPSFTGTGQPGSTITVTYGARSGATEVAGTGTVNVDGFYAITTDFSALEPGSNGSGADVYQTDPSGNPIAGAGTLSRGFSFATPPVALTPMSLTLAPSATTVSETISNGVALSAAGFSPNEEVIVTVTAPNGSTVVLAGTRPDHTFASDINGSYTENLTLPAGSNPGTYTATVTGVRTARVATGTFMVTADPTTPAATPGSNSPLPAAEMHLPVVSG